MFAAAVLVAPLFPLSSPSADSAGFSRLYVAPVESDIKGPSPPKSPSHARSAIRRMRHRNSEAARENRRRALAAAAAYSQGGPEVFPRGFTARHAHGDPNAPTSTSNPGSGTAVLAADRQAREQLFSGPLASWPEPRPESRPESLDALEIAWTRLFNNSTRAAPDSPQTRAARYPLEVPDMSPSVDGSLNPVMNRWNPQNSGSRRATPRDEVSLTVCSASTSLLTYAPRRNRRLGDWPPAPLRLRGLLATFRPSPPAAVGSDVLPLPIRGPRGTWGDSRKLALTDWVTVTGASVPRATLSGTLYSAP